MSGGLKPGAVIGARYRLVRLLGEGGMGWVWEAIDTTTDRSVALKLLKSDKDEDRRRFHREVRAAAAIKHPNVIEVHDFVELTDGTLVIVMDLLAGETLGAIVRRKGRITLGELAAVLMPVLSALEAAHAEGIIHRDLKPDNIFLCTTPTGAAVKVLDFGIAKLTATDGLAARTQALTGTGSMIGTPYYMSPEQVFADKDLDSRADTWSLGIVIYECLTGVRPTEADTVGRVLKRIMVGDFAPITTHCKGMADEVTSLVRRMLATNRDDRPRDLAEIREVLEPHAGERFPSFSPTGGPHAVDPTAATIPTPDAGPRPSDTNRAVSVIPRTLGTRSRRILVGAAVGVAVLGTGAVVQISRFVGTNAAASPSSSSYPTASEPPPPLSVSVSVGVTPSVSVGVPAASSSPVVPAAPPTTPEIGTPTQVRSAAAPTPAPPPAMTVSKPSCRAGEVPSGGHCCPLGHVWQSGRCERPFATSF